MEKFSVFEPETDFLYAMGMGAPLMFGWTVLLLWADRKPKERREILVITVFPVITGLLVNRLLGLSSGFVNLEGSLVSIVIPVFLIVLLLAAYMYSYHQGWTSG